MSRTLIICNEIKPIQEGSQHRIEREMFVFAFSQKLAKFRFRIFEKIASGNRRKKQKRNRENVIGNEQMLTFH